MCIFEAAHKITLWSGTTDKKRDGRADPKTGWSEDAFGQCVYNATIRDRYKSLEDICNLMTRPSNTEYEVTGSIFRRGGCICDNVTTTKKRHPHALFGTGEIAVVGLK